ncbi:threonylcarbamoyl-AMP synthase [Patescibacteria group bacterium]|nr:threonylcarbamoyl-AMP synthase [Patescibacteria group bacterium]
MEIIKFNLAGDWNDLDNTIIQKAIEVLKRGGGVIYPTDTVYGLGVDALNIKAIERLFKIKKRPGTKPVPIIVRDIDMAKKYAYINRAKEKILNSVWPGKVTVILPKRDAAPDVLTAGKKTIGIRVSAHPFIRLLMEELDFPITATSANFSGEPPLSSSFEVIKTFERAYPRPELILDAGDLPENSPSTLLDLSGLKPKITRLGPVSKKDLMKMFK